MMKKIAVLAASGLIGLVMFGSHDAEAQRRGWSGSDWHNRGVAWRGGGWGGGYRTVYRGGYGYRSGAVVAGVAVGALGAAAAYPYYGGGYYPAYSYGYGASYPSYGYGVGYYGGGYYAPRRVVVSRRVVYRGGYGYGGGYGRRYRW